MTVNIETQNAPITMADVIYMTTEKPFLNRVIEEAHVIENSETAAERRFFYLSEKAFQENKADSIENVLQIACFTDAPTTATAIKRYESQGYLSTAGVDSRKVFNALHACFSPKFGYETFRKYRH